MKDLYNETLKGAKSNSVRRRCGRRTRWTRRERGRRRRRRPAGGRAGGGAAAQGEGHARRGPDQPGGVRRGEAEDPRRYPEQAPSERSGISDGCDSLPDHRDPRSSSVTPDWTTTKAPRPKGTKASTTKSSHFELHHTPVRGCRTGSRPWSMTRSTGDWPGGSATRADSRSLPTSDAAASDALGAVVPIAADACGSSCLCAFTPSCGPAGRPTAVLRGGVGLRARPNSSTALDRLGAGGTDRGHHR